MKKKTKRILAGILAAGIVLHTPVCVESAETVGRIPISAHLKIREYINDEEEASQERTQDSPESISQEISDDKSTDTSECSTEDITEEGSSDTSESITEETSDREASEEELESTLEDITQEQSSDTSEDVTEELSEDTAEELSENITEEQSEELPGQTETDASEIKKSARILPEVTNEGELDYRDCIDGVIFPEISVKAVECTDSMLPPEQVSDNEGKVLSADDLDNVHFVLNLDNKKIVAPQYMEEVCVYDSTKACFKDSMTLDVIGVGETSYSVEALGNCDYNMSPGAGRIHVYNSPLLDSDFYIEVSGGKHQQNYTYDEWITYLEAHDNWVDGNVNVRLSEKGEKYYTAMQSEETDVSDNMKTYTLWAENPERNASSKNVENGTRTYTVGIDIDSPILTMFETDSKCYEPTKTDTEQYFSGDFVLNGSFQDVGIGLDRVEYTTDAAAGDQAEWTQLEGAKQGAETCDFQIILSDGCYNAIAVRAYDLMGNVSAVNGFVNEQGEYIKVIVDKSEPVLHVDVRSDDRPYDGSGDNWTNKDVVFRMASDFDSCPYAGIYQFEYKYEKIGEASHGIDAGGAWTALSWEDDPETALEVSDDKNGYYSFRALSKSGVASHDIIRERVLIQHQAAEIKPMIVSDVDDAKRINEWYNKESGVPVIHFEYPEYDAGEVSGEYNAPITIHYKITAKTEEHAKIPVSVERSAIIGVMSSENAAVRAGGVRKFVLTKDNLDDFVVDFGYNEKTKEVQDGIYTLEYWSTDRAGNESERQIQVYKIDIHEPTNIVVEINGSTFPVGQKSTIVYEKFYRDKVTGKASAQYGVSGKESLQIKRVRKPGEWKDLDNTGFDGKDHIEISPNTKCFLYVQAKDKAGNVAEGWTMGIVVDNMVPNGANGMSMIMAPEGANAHGFFNRDVAVKINVKDAPGEDNYAALMSVINSIGRDGNDTITDQELFSFKKEFPTDEELKQAAVFETIQIIKAAENESNNAYIEVTAADRAENTKTFIQLLKIDVTKPKISISFDNNDVRNGSYYQQGRIATIHVTERNFDPEAVRVTVYKNGKPSDFQVSGWTHDGIDHYAVLEFTDDGNYWIEASCTDLADNESEKVRTDIFTIDRTAPVITLDLVSGQSTLTKEYFNASVTAVITVIEQNFNEADFMVNIVPEAAGGVWSHNGNVHTMEFVFGDEKSYHIDCAYTDLAGNTARQKERTFTIDKTAPVIAIEGIQDGSANMGEILPVVTVLDDNMEMSGTEILVVSGTGDPVENAIETAVITGMERAGFQFTLSDMTDKADNVYYLTVTSRDKAGNTSELTYRFSLNRNGSVYDMRKLADFVESQYNRYDKLGDIQIVEMNVDAVDEFDLYISKNGELGYKAAYIKEISGSEKTGYTYVYKIDGKNFAEEGIYRLSLYSRDRAGNEVNNAEDIRGNEISFIVDNTPPKVIINGVESGSVYDVESQLVQIVVTDNFKLEEAVFTLVNEENEILESWDYMELAGEGETLDITIPKYNGEISLVYRVKDAAGNEMQTFLRKQEALDDFPASTDKLMQFVNKPAKTPFGCVVLFMAGVPVLIAGSFIVRNVYRRKFSKR